MKKTDNQEQARMDALHQGSASWHKWGPYLAERQWGTVREDYSENGDAWEYFPHDHARSRAYRWGEDGLAGLSDDKQQLCLSLAMWNGEDPILKERLFGLTNAEGNHGEDVKELYYYLDAAPSHTYLKMLYKYPQRAYPYDELIEMNAKRGYRDREFEILDTQAFADNRYFDVFVEYIQLDENDIGMIITAHNRSAQEAPLHLLPQVTFRNTWTWYKDAQKPSARLGGDAHVALDHPDLGAYYCYVDQDTRFLFTENETNSKLHGGEGSAYSKDAFHRFVIDGEQAAVNPAQLGTKFAAYNEYSIPGGEQVTLRLRISKQPQSQPFEQFGAIHQQRVNETDHFYQNLQQGINNEEHGEVQRQAFAGLVWSKQYYYFDVPEWLSGDETQPPPPEARRKRRNWEWQHLNNADVISMPDKWEYPWYAAWDLAFHMIPFALIDSKFAKRQLLLLTKEWYMHPNGQLPAYEWEFGDVNPPVHAWAAWRVFKIDRKQRGKGDYKFLERIFHKLMLNFTWWVNRKDNGGLNIFQGGFLGLDNIGVFDRSRPLPTGGHLNQADGTSWMAMYSLNLMRIALELATENSAYEDVATKFFEHFLHIAEAMTNIGGKDIGLWDEEDKFFYDELILPDGNIIPLRLRSMVGLIPLYAVEVIDQDLLDKLPNFKRRLLWYLDYKPEVRELVELCEVPGQKERRLLALMQEDRLRSVLDYLLDETEFLSPYGIRSLSRVHEDNPYRFRYDGHYIKVGYVPAESDTYLFGGNSNWRGPIWFPVNYLLIESLQKFHYYYGDRFKVECPKGSGQYMTLSEVADELANRLTKIFMRDENGRRPVLSHRPNTQVDPYFEDHLLFYEYFHGDTGRGAGASHQTGWTALIAKLLHPKSPNH